MSGNDLNAFLEQRIERTVPTELNPQHVKVKVTPLFTFSHKLFLLITMMNGKHSKEFKRHFLLTARLFNYRIPRLLLIRIVNQKKKEYEKSMMIQEPKETAEDKTAKKHSKEISFNMPQSFTNTARASEFPSLAEAAKISAEPRKPIEKEVVKPVEKETRKLTTPYFKTFVNSKKDYSKPSFKELEAPREFPRRSEYGPRYGYRRNHDSRVY